MAKRRIFYPQLKKLLEEGKTAEIIRISDAILRENSLPPEKEREIHEWRAEAFFRQKEYDRSKEEGKKAKASDFGKERLSNIAAAKGEGDKVEKYTTCTPRSVRADNARVMAGRQAGSTLSRTEVLAIADKWLKVLPPDEDRTELANLANNTSRYWLAKAASFRDLELARYYMKLAIKLYGSGNKNYHHRAGAHFWLSVITEKMGNRQAAMLYAKRSVRLWRKQLRLDPQNKNFLSSFRGAKNRLKELKRPNRQP
jgi:tetratricopeptide (TPR) repeat protein